MFSALTGGASAYVPQQWVRVPVAPVPATLEMIFLTFILLVGVNRTRYYAFHVLMFGAQLTRVDTERWSNTGKLRNQILG